MCSTCLPQKGRCRLHPGVCKVECQSKNRLLLSWGESGQPPLLDILPDLKHWCLHSCNAHHMLLFNSVMLVWQDNARTEFKQYQNWMSYKQLTAVSMSDNVRRSVKARSWWDRLVEVNCFCYPVCLRGGCTVRFCLFLFYFQTSVYNCCKSCSVTKFLLQESGISVMFLKSWLTDSL